MPRIRPTIAEMEARIKHLQDAMSQTNSDMFEHFALLEIEGLERKIKRRKKAGESHGQSQRSDNEPKG